MQIIIALLVTVLGCQANAALLPLLNNCPSRFDTVEFLRSQERAQLQLLAEAVATLNGICPLLDQVSFSLELTDKLQTVLVKDAVDAAVNTTISVSDRFLPKYCPVNPLQLTIDVLKTVGPVMQASATSSKIASANAAVELLQEYCGTDFDADEISRQIQEFVALDFSPMGLTAAGLVIEILNVWYGTKLYGVLSL